MTQSTLKEPFAIEALPYDYTALQPYISEQTLRFHHDKHYGGYISKVNELTLDTPYTSLSLESITLSADGALLNNAAQAWNHRFYFDQFSPHPQSTPKGKLIDMIDHYFGSLDSLKGELHSHSLSLFGSGWVWLVEDHSGRLGIINESNAGTPIRYNMRPLLTLDVWEHAYYLDYQNRRGDAIKAL